MREKNRFTFGPIIEVAVLFAGIFITMTPALLILNARGARLGLREPWQFFWASGLVVERFGQRADLPGVHGGGRGIAGHSAVKGSIWRTLSDLGAGSGLDEILAAISCGCVFMGALTYIGNGPNFMVRAIAQESNIRMPGFLGYMVYSMTILIPLLCTCDDSALSFLTLRNVPSFRAVPVVLKITVCRAVRVQGLSRRRDANLSLPGKHA